MSNLSFGNQKSKYKHLLVFDTIALLSADESNRVQVWRNNEQLGECYIPGATYAEISKFAQDYKNSKDQARARAFLEFQSKGGHYKTQPTEDNRKIPLDNPKDRQILACAYRLAAENPNSAVILVTYDATMQALVKQSGLPNFCYLTAKDIAEWFHNLYYQNKVPQAVHDTYQRMKQFPKEPFTASGGHNGNRRNHVVGKEEKQPRRIEQVAEQPRLKSAAAEQPRKSHQNSQQADQSSTLKPQKNRFFSPVALSIAVACVAVVTLLGTGFFTKNHSTTVVAQAQVDNQPVESTPPNLISQAEATIIEFQKTKDGSVLRDSLNELQTLKNKQGVRLDEQGEQRLSRLKHKYAIEVLASSGQKAEAVKMLKEVSPKYSEFGDVKKWIKKLNK
ncbi:hypothetical protein SAMD00079811_65000 [Scytonema sp. HK-05]|uniref:PIN domain-containing protein n=1 Tax=Scytonema sp. HK-05 TaxID=1137095 RepID=UPI000935EDE1|nr:PIN domain-containing protein [Scytonema sp. HK-05]OKH54919.1 hypothetical protein NIES2130_27740 [Scytonema sp. HK-05]BAY48871.1 hypothetical protein SAMD00079811_65000 [Scytonema sp. HK-05]